MLIEKETTDIFWDISSDNNFFWISEEKNELSRSQILYDKVEKYLSLSIYKNIYFVHIRLHFSTGNNCNIIYEGKRLLIHLVQPTIKEEKLHNMTRYTRDCTCLKVH